MKKVLLIVFLIISIFAAFIYARSFFFRGHTVQVQDVTQKQIITLIEKERPQSVYGINILITGYIDGAATIEQFYENQETHKSTVIGGKVNLRIGGDWYEDKCLIIYEPSNVKSGRLQIKYKFRTIRKGN